LGAMVQVWEVVGGGDKGGIMARAGKELKSAELPERLSTGALVRELELVGERLHYALLSGEGPAEGWVSLKVKNTDIVMKSSVEWQEPVPVGKPVLALFYSGGMTAGQGRANMKGLIGCAKTEGIEDVAVLDHVGEKGFEDCKDFDDYVGRLAAKLDTEKLAGRPVIIMAHSHGSLPGWGLAKRLGARCLKLYVMARRPPNGPLLDETWDVDCAEKVAGLDEQFMLERMVEAWPNDFLSAELGAQKKKQAPLTKACKDVLAVVKRQYGSPALPCGSADVGKICSGDIAISAPIMALSAEWEAEPKGETASKMEGWRAFTKGGFEHVTVPGVDHMGIVYSVSPSMEILMKDVKKLL